MAKKNPIKRSLRDQEIEKALTEIYASSEDELSDEEELSVTSSLYPSYDINQALDDLQKVTDVDLLKIFEEDVSSTLQPITPGAISEVTLTAKKPRLSYHPSPPAVIVEVLPSAFTGQLSPSGASKLPWNPVAFMENLPSATTLKPSSLSAAQVLSSAAVAVLHPSSSAAAHHTSSSAATHQPSPPADIMEALPTSITDQLSPSGAARQPSSPAVSIEKLPSATTPKPLFPAAATALHPLSLADIMETLPTTITGQFSPSEAAHQPSSAAVVLENLPPTTHKPLSQLATPHLSSSAATNAVPLEDTSSPPPEVTQHALLQEVMNKVRDWSGNTTEFAAPAFTQNLKSRKFYNNRSLHLDYFSDIFPSEIFDIITENTNSYASFMQFLNWSQTDSTETRAYLGVIIMMGLHPLSELELYWSSDPFYHNPVISAVMTCKRFKKLTENLHLNDKATEIPRTQPRYDKLAKIRPISNILNNSFEENCIGSHTQCVDESMVKFKGKSVMKQYMPNKPIKRGYKAWARCDSETGYLYQFSVYCGKSETADDGDGGLGYKVVMELCRKVGCGTLVAFDNFFTSLPLLEMLHLKNIFSVGTVRLNKKGLPPRLLPNKGDKRENKLKVGEFMFQYAAPISVIKWRDTKDVYVCTTAFDPKAVVNIQRTQKDGQKAAMTCPLTIEQYTRYMGGVDRFDHYRSSNSIGRKSTKKNWIRLFWFLLEAACINAYIVYSLTHKKTSSSHREFRLKLARSLIDNFTTRVREPPVFKNKKGGFGVSDEIRLNNVGVHMPCEGTRRRCRYCSTRKIPQRSKIMCRLCQVPLCAAPCFDNFHR